MKIRPPQQSNRSPKYLIILMGITMALAFLVDLTNAQSTSCEDARTFLDHSEIVEQDGQAMVTIHNRSSSCNTTVTLQTYRVLDASRGSELLSKVSTEVEAHTTSILSIPIDASCASWTRVLVLVNNQPVPVQDLINTHHPLCQ